MPVINGRLAEGRAVNHLARYLWTVTRVSRKVFYERFYESCYEGFYEDCYEGRYEIVPALFAHPLLYEFNFLRARPSANQRPVCRITHA